MFPLDIHQQLFTDDRKRRCRADVESSQSSHARAKHITTIIDPIERHTLDQAGLPGNPMGGPGDSHLHNLRTCAPTSFTTLHRSGPPLQQYYLPVDALTISPARFNRDTCCIGQIHHLATYNIDENRI